MSAAIPRGTSQTKTNGRVACVQHGAELNCLIEKMGELESEDTKLGASDDACRIQVENIVRLQSVDYRLNRALERACRPMVEKHCQTLADADIDNGDVVQCLLKHRRDPEMSPKCRTYVDHYELVRSLQSLHAPVKQFILHRYQCVIGTSRRASPRLARTT